MIALKCVSGLGLVKIRCCAASVATVAKSSSQIHAGRGPVDVRVGFIPKGQHIRCGGDIERTRPAYASAFAYDDQHMATDTKPKGGLEDVVATSSAICYLDGERGVLAYCGYDIHDLAQSATFEEVCYLLWHRRLPTRAELGDLRSQFAASSGLPDPIVKLIKALPQGDGMDALRTLTSALAHYDTDAADRSPRANYRKSVRLTAQLG